MAKRKTTPAEIYELEIALADTNPKIWRRFAVKSNITLAKLHDIIQIVMGWTNSHLHHFIDLKEQRYGPHHEYSYLDTDIDVIDESKMKVRGVMPEKGSRLVYEYDFGDDWIHLLEVVAVHPPEPGVRYPRCLAGERACPPEDVGGVGGYYSMLEILADPEDEERETYLEWLGAEFAPERFDLDDVNDSLRAIR